MIVHRCLICQQPKSRKGKICRACYLKKVRDPIPYRFGVVAANTKFRPGDWAIIRAGTPGPASLHGAEVFILRLIRGPGRRIIYETASKEFRGRRYFSAHHLVKKEDRNDQGPV